MAELRSYTPTLRERLQYGIAKMFYGDTREGYHKAQSAVDALDLTPLGVPMQAYDAGRALGSGDYVAAALGGGALALPMAGGVLGKVAGKGVNEAQGVVDAGLKDLDELLKGLANPEVPPTKPGVLYEAPQVDTLGGKDYTKHFKGTHAENAKSWVNAYANFEVNKDDFLGNITPDEMPYVIKELGDDPIAKEVPAAVAKQFGNEKVFGKLPPEAKAAVESEGLAGLPDTITTKGEGWYGYTDPQDWVAAYNKGLISDQDFFMNTIAKDQDFVINALGPNHQMSKDIAEFKKSYKIPAGYDPFVDETVNATKELDTWLKEGKPTSSRISDKPTITTTELLNDWLHAANWHGFDSPEALKASTAYADKVKLENPQDFSGILKSNYDYVKKMSSKHFASLEKEAAAGENPNPDIKAAYDKFAAALEEKGFKSPEADAAGILYHNTVAKKYGNATADAMHATVLDEAKTLHAQKDKYEQVPFIAGFDDIDKWFSKELGAVQNTAWKTGDEFPSMAKSGIYSSLHDKLLKEFQDLGIPTHDPVTGDLSDSFLDAFDKYAYNWNEAAKAHADSLPTFLEKIGEKFAAPLEKVANKVENFLEPDYKPGDVPFMTQKMQQAWKGGENPEFKIPDKALATEEMLAGLELNPQVFYHGSNKQLKEFLDPANYKGSHEPAIFLSDQKDISRSYGKNIYPLHARMKNPYIVEDFGPYSSSKVTEAIREAKKGGHDSVILKGMQDVGGDQTQYLMLDPTQLRSVWAKMDPSKKNLADLMAGLAGGGVLAGGVLGGGGGDEAQAMELLKPPSDNVEDRRGMGTPFTPPAADQTFNPISSEWFDQPKKLPYNTVPQEYADQQLQDVMADLQRKDAITSLRKQLQARLKALQK